MISDDSITYPNVHIVQGRPQTSCDPLQPNGELTATVDNGNDDTNPKYEFAWYEGADTTGTFIANTSMVGGLEAIEHTISVYDTLTGCISIDYHVVEDGKEKFRLQVSAASTSQFSCVADDGSLSATVLNVTGNFQFDWYENAQIVYTGTPYEPVAPGIYIVTALDVNDIYCPSEPVEIEVGDKRSNPEITLNEDNPLTNCWDDQPNAQLSANVDGKVGGYTFEWFNGPEATGTPEWTTATYRELFADTYTLRVTDNRTGCFSVKTVTVIDSTVTPPVATIEILSHQVSCVEPPAGLLTAFVDESGNRNITDYYFDWYDGAGVTGSSDFRGVKYRELDVGDYTVTALDMITGCVSDGVSEEILDERVFPILAFHMIPAKCERSDGQVEVEVVNSIPIGSVFWYDEFGSEIEQGAGLYNYPTGIYEISVITFEGCGVIETTEIGGRYI